MENPIKMDDLGVKPLFSETSIKVTQKEQKNAPNMLPSLPTKIFFHGSREKTTEKI